MNYSLTYKSAHACFSDRGLTQSSYATSRGWVRELQCADVRHVTTPKLAGSHEIIRSG